MQTSTPIQDSPPRLREQVQKLHRKVQELTLENETLMYELEQTKLENENLYQALKEKDMIQTKMGEQLNMVTNTAYALYEKFTAFKRRYYEEQSAWCANGK